MENEQERTTVDFLRQGDVGIYVGIGDESMLGKRLDTGVVAEGEGHHVHTLEGEAGVDYEIYDAADKDGDFDMFVRVLKEGGVSLDHLSLDGSKGEHESQHLPKGIHPVRMQREENPADHLSPQRVLD